ncbi:MAG: deoxyguanosinetriphosphate triphosphohydrolase [Lachnospiraceae bacterium]
MKWEQLLSIKRSRDGQGKKPYKSADLRSEFEKDYHRIIGSASFRRLQDKTQVFPLDKSDFIRTRLTHSLEVSSFAKSLGQNIGESILNNGNDLSFTIQMKEDICNILQCAGLIHDIGNPPFGHFGEDAIREWFQRNLPTLFIGGKSVEQILTPQMREDFYHFEGNAQALRLVSKLHYLVDEQGMNLTYALLGTIIKYPVSSLHIQKHGKNMKDKKMGYYYADQEIFRDIQKETGTDGNRHPLAFVLEAADDLAYKTADIEDAFVKGFISFYVLKEELQKLDEAYPDMGFQAMENLEKQYRRGVEHQVENPEEYAVKNWIVRVQGFLIRCATEGFTLHYNEIMEGIYSQDLFYHTGADPLMKLLGDVACRYVFLSPEIYRMEVSEATIIDFLMDRFVKAVIEYDTGKTMHPLDVRMISFISDNYKSAYHFHAQGKSEAEKLYLRLLLITDYICGMTDSYAKRLYQELNGIL